MGSARNSIIVMARLTTAPTRALLFAIFFEITGNRELAKKPPAKVVTSNTLKATE